MTTMTEYWQNFSAAIDAFEEIAGELESHYIKPSRDMLALGLRMESMKSGELKQVTKALYVASKAFGNSFMIAGEKGYLPKVEDKKSLIYALIYYQHLQIT